MPIVRRSRRLSDQATPDPLDQCVPGGFNYLDIPYTTTEPLVVGHSVVPTAGTFDPASLSPQTIERLCAFADQRELPPPDLHSQCRRRKGKNGNAPRPPNAFMLFRSDFWRFNKETIPERDHRQISRIAGACWNALEEPRRIPYQDQARKLKDEHAELYPQHKYNLSAKEKAAKKVKKEESDDDDICGVIAVQVAQDVGASASPKAPGSGESGLLDQIAEQNVNLKRPRPASTVAVAKRASQPPVKKRKRNHRKPSIAAAPAPVVPSQVDPSHPPSPPCVSTNGIPAFALPTSHASPAVEVEALQVSALEVAAQIVAAVTANNQPALSPPKMESPELEVPERPISMSPVFSFDDKFTPVQWFPQSADAAVNKGLQFSEAYGLSGPTEGLDFSAFDTLGDGSVANEYDEFTDSYADWLLL